MIWMDLDTRLTNCAGFEVQDMGHAVVEMDACRCVSEQSKHVSVKMGENLGVRQSGGLVQDHAHADLR